MVIDIQCKLTMYTIQSTLYIIPWSCITNTTHYDVI